MFNHYADILSRIAEPPKWWDEQGVPRYCAFGPDAIANIYAHECVLLAIECSGCGQTIIAALDDHQANNVLRVPGKETPRRKIADLIRAGELDCGDPPNVGCCRGGPSTGALTRRVLQYWARYQDSYGPLGSIRFVRGSFDWQRDRSLELPVTPREED
ncbi:MAG TPA: hypothetical protein VL993_02700 [Stellaceae bacterium]|nr:hypothetical protein [Stellaceae bacterium]